MGKCTRKPRTSGDVSAVDVSPSSLGVRTRAKILALQRLHSSCAFEVSPQPDYLELRSRRLEKLPPPRQCLRNVRNIPTSEQSIGSRLEESPLIETLPEKPCFGSEVSFRWDEGNCSGRRSGGFEIGDLEIEVSFGENNFDVENRERTTRERTPCNLIRAADTIAAPGSSTKQRSPASANRTHHNTLRIIALDHELEEFLDHEEQSQQRYFAEKYNFDVVNDRPLPGRYKWVKFHPTD